MRLPKSMLVSLMILSLTNFSMAQTVEVVPAPVPMKVKKIDLKSPEATKKVSDLIQKEALCQMNLTSTTEAYKKCTAEVSPPLSFWQQPLGMVVLGVLSAAAGAGLTCATHAFGACK